MWTCIYVSTWLGSTCLEKSCWSSCLWLQPVWSFVRPGNLKKHKRTCTGGQVPAARVEGAVPIASAATKRRIAPEFKLQKTRKSFDVAVEQFTVDMKEVNHLSELKRGIAVFTARTSCIQVSDYSYCRLSQGSWSSCCYTTTSNSNIGNGRCRCVSSSCIPPTAKFVEVYEHNGSGWVFSNFASLQLALWHLDSFRASAFVPLPSWIREKNAVVNFTGTGDDCFKWAVLAGMHSVGRHEHPSRMDKLRNMLTSITSLLYAFPYPYLLFVHLLRQTVYLSMCML